MTNKTFVYLLFVLYLGYAAAYVVGVTTQELWWIRVPMGVHLLGVAYERITTKAEEGCLNWSRTFSDFTLVVWLFWSIWEEDEKTQLNVGVGLGVAGVGLCLLKTWDILDKLDSVDY